MTARVRVPATTANLGPGFDTFAAALALHLYAEVAEPSQVRVSVGGVGAGELPSDESNSVWRGFARLFEHVGGEPPDVTLRVVSDVPLESGLGSSAAAFVAGLALGRAIAGARLPDRTLVDLASELEGHPDNAAAAVLGGLVTAARTDDGALVLRRVTPHPRLRPMIFLAPTRQATSEARALLPETLDARDVATTAGRAAHVFGALGGAWPADVTLVGDRFHEPPRLAAAPMVAAVVDALRAAGVHAWLSGAGPCVAAAVAASDASAHERCHAVADAHGWVLVESAWDLSGAVTTYVHARPPAGTMSAV